MNSAEALARATGSVGAAYTVVRVGRDGATTVVERHGYSRGVVGLCGFPIDDDDDDDG